MMSDQEKAEYQKQLEAYFKKGGKITKFEIGERSEEGQRGVWGKKPAQKKTEDK
tara:strand:- start:3910 stop:4071 length:162 start_codon:yes stop_codon:yes gene_type:complete